MRRQRSCIDKSLSWSSWGSGASILLSAVLFLDVSMDKGWLTPPIRMVIGLLVASGLLVICQWKAGGRYTITGAQRRAARARHGNATHWRPT